MAEGEKSGWEGIFMERSSGPLRARGAEAPFLAGVRGAAEAPVVGGGLVWRLRMRIRALARAR